MNISNFTTQVTQVNNFFELIQSKDSELQEISTLPYYKVFTSMNEKKRDSFEVMEEKKDALSNLYASLESLQITIELLKADISYEKREITLEAQKINSLSTR